MLAAQAGRQRLLSPGQDRVGRHPFRRMCRGLWDEQGEQRHRLPETPGPAFLSHLTISIPSQEQRKPDPRRSVLPSFDRSDSALAGFSAEPFQFDASVL